MKTWTLLALVGLLACRAHAADGDTALATVTELGKANGQALACSEKEASARVKSLILRHVPKTPGFGQAFEEATQQGFLAQVKGQSPCPQARVIADRIDVLAQRLGELLPTEPR